MTFEMLRLSRGEARPLSKLRRTGAKLQQIQYDMMPHNDSLQCCKPHTHCSNLEALSYHLQFYCACSQLTARENNACNSVCIAPQGEHYCIALSTISDSACNSACIAPQGEHCCIALSTISGSACTTPQWEHCWMPLSNGIHSADSYTSPQWENIVRAQRPCPIVRSAVHNPPQWECSLSSLLPESPWCEGAFHRHWLQQSVHSEYGLNAAQAATGLIVPQVAAPDMQLTACYNCGHLCTLVQPVGVLASACFHHSSPVAVWYILQLQHCDSAVCYCPQHFYIVMQPVGSLALASSHTSTEKMLETTCYSLELHLCDTSLSALQCGTCLAAPQCSFSANMQSPTLRNCAVQVSPLRLQCCLLQATMKLRSYSLQCCKPHIHCSSLEAPSYHLQFSCACDHLTAKCNQDEVTAELKSDCSDNDELLPYTLPPLHYSYQCKYMEAPQWESGINRIACMAPRWEHCCILLSNVIDSACRTPQWEHCCIPLNTATHSAGTCTSPQWKHSAGTCTSPRWEHNVKSHRPSPMAYNTVQNPSQWEYSFSTLLPESSWCESASHRYWLQHSAPNHCGLIVAQPATGLIVPQVEASDKQLIACSKLLSCLCRDVAIPGNCTVLTIAPSVALNQVHKPKLLGRANWTRQQSSLTWMPHQWAPLQLVGYDGWNVLLASVPSDRKAPAKE